MRNHSQRATRNRADCLPQRRVSLCVRTALLGAVPMFAAVAVHAATITVDSLADGAPAMDGACTLREAIVNANDDTDASGGDCAAGSGEDSIVFSSFGTITLGSELPILTDTERTTIAGDINGDGNIDVTVSGNHAVRVFQVANDAVATLSWLTVTDGNTGSSGGGLLNYGDLLIRHSTVSGNSAGTYGGGIRNWSSASLQIDHSTIANNIAGIDGGGIEQGGTAAVTNSTLYGNHANHTGGAIDAWNGSLIVSHSTLAGNSADYVGGGVYVGSPVTFSHTIIAGNTAANCAFDDGEVLIDGGDNLQFGDSSCDAAIPVGDPMLGALQDNGGPTFTMLPGAGSPAIDAVACDPAVTDDQRGAPRPNGALCDIGAVEVGPVPMVVTTLADTDVDDGLCSLREAIGNANADDQSGSVDCGRGVGEDLIRFQVPGTIMLGSELPMLIDTERTTIDGDIGANGNSDITISGNATHQLFSVAQYAVVDMSHLSLIDGFAGDAVGRDGGAIYNHGVLELFQCTVSGNSALSYGGAIYNDNNDGATLSIDHSTIADNTAGIDGGGIDNNGTLVVSNSTFHGNHSDNRGGAIDAWSGSLTISHSTLAGNSADGGSGGIHVSSSVTLSHTIVASNTGGNCGDGGGALTDSGGNLLWPATDSSCVGFFGDPLLGPSQDNGGPTFTMLPGTGSAAVDAVTCDPAVADDQRGVARPQGSVCDIGAVEVNPVDLDRIFANGFE